jgi:hypothetical protein
MPETLTIEIKDGGVSQGPPPVPTYSPPAPPGGKPPPGSGRAPTAFDAADEARKQVEAERRRMLVKAEYEKLVPPKPPAPFSAADEARKAVEAERRKALVKSEYDRLVPPKPEPGFSAADEARKQVEAERRKTLVKSEYEKLVPPTPPPAFDPGEVARKMVEAQRRQQLVQTEYRKQTDPYGAKAAGQMATAGVQQAGSALGAIGRLDAGGLADGFQSLASTVPVFGTVIAGATGAARKFMAGLDETSRRLAGYNGTLAVAQAQADVRQIMGDIRRANSLGDPMAKYVEARSKLSDAGQDALAKILKPLLPLITKIVDLLTAATEGIGNVGGAVAEVVANPVEEAREAWKQLFGAVGVIEKNTRPKPPEADVDPLFGLFDVHNPPGIFPGMKPNIGPAPQMNIPAFEGL